MPAGIRSTRSATSAISDAWQAAGPQVAQVDIARKLAEAIWHMLTRNESFAPAGAALSQAA